MKIVMLANNPCVFDARIIREAEALAEAGHDVTVLATRSEGLARQEVRLGVCYRRVKEITEFRKTLSTGPSGQQPLRERARLPMRFGFHVGRAVITPSLRHLVGYAAAYAGVIAELRPDVVHAHDLDTLLAGWIGAMRAGARLVYDAHELETDRNQKTSRYERWLRALVERFLIRRAGAVITVSDGIADYLAERYRLPRPAVILNAPASAAANPDDADLRSNLGLAEDVPLALYIGGMMPDRGIEQAVEALAHLPDVHLAALGPREAATENRVRERVEALQLQHRLHLVDPVPPETLESYIASADVSLVLLQNTCLNHYFCFPNKLLQSLLAGVPVVVARLVELERMISMTGAGLVADETDPKAIASAIREVLADSTAYRPDEACVRRLRESHGWPQQRRRLLDLYDDLAGKRPVARGMVSMTDSHEQVG